MDNPTQSTEGLWARLKGLFTPGSKASASAAGLLAEVRTPGAAPRRGTLELLNAYRTNGWLRAVVERVCSEVAQQEFELYRSKRRGGGRSKTFVTRSSVAYRPKDAEEVEAHPFLDLLARPNPLQSRWEFLFLVSAYLDLKGEAPIIAERAADGAPVELWVVPPHWLLDLPRRDAPVYRFGWGSWHRLIPEDDVLFIRHPDIANPFLRGAGRAEAASDELEIGELSTKHLKSWFFNRGVPDVFLSIGGVSTKAEAEKYQKELASKYNALRGGNMVHVTNGTVDVKQLGHTFREQQLPELRIQERDFALQLWGVPPEVMGIIENSNRATIDAAWYLFIRGVVVPRLAFLCDALNPWVRAQWGDDSLVVGVDSPVPEDAEFRLRVFQAAPECFAKNEWRELAGKSERAEFGDDLREPAPALPFGTPSGGGEPPSAPEPEEEPEDDAEEDPEDEDSEEETKTARPVRRDVNAVAAALKPERLEGLTRAIERTIAAVGARTLSDLGFSGSFDMRNPLVTDYLDSWREQRIAGITKATRDDVTRVMQQATAEGVGIDETRRRLKRYFEVAADYRAERIARTEVVSSSNAANLAAYQISGLVDGKEWLSVQDDQTRDSHRALDGQTASIEGRFRAPSGLEAQGPGLFGVPEEDINCRCTVLPVIGEAKALEGDARASVWRAWVRGIEASEKELNEQAAGAFAAWGRDALAAL